MRTTINAAVSNTKDRPKTFTATFGELREMTVPVHELVAKKPSAVFRHDVEAVGSIRDAVQRDMKGQKLTNAKRSLPEYIKEHIVNGVWTGPLWTVIIYLAYKLDLVSGTEEWGEYTIDTTRPGFLLDGESRFYSLEEIVLSNEEPALRRAVLEIPLNVILYDGVEVDRAAQHFRDVNGLGVGINASVLVSHDYSDPFLQVTNRVFDALGIEVERQARQVSATSPAVVTIVQARSMVAAVAHGIGAVQYGAGRIPTKADDVVVDFDRLEAAAKTWLAEVFGSLGIEAFRDKNLVLRAIPMMVALAAAGRAFYTGDVAGQDRARSLLADERIDWSTGAHWAGIAGKWNPTGGVDGTGSFTVGSGKEVGYAAFRGLTDDGSASYYSVRKLSAPADLTR